MLINYVFAFDTRFSVCFSLRMFLCVFLACAIFESGKSWSLVACSVKHGGFGCAICMFCKKRVLLTERERKRDQCFQMPENQATWADKTSPK